MPALEFIDKLVKLIPDRNFKLTRYYGIYARRTRNKLRKILTPLTKDTPKPTANEPITCPECGTPMQLISITRPN
jgi:acetone carboxylase gamma subunit